MKEKQIIAQPFELRGEGNAALLFLHGFTGSPSEVSPTAVLLHERYGFTVSGIMLPGHGTTPEDLDNTSWRDWTAAVENELTRLGSMYQHLFVGGLSMGGLLSLYIPTQQEQISGVISINAPIFVKNPCTTSWLVSALTPLLGLIKPYYPKAGIENGLELEKLGRQAYHCYPLKAFGNMLKLRRLVLGGLNFIRCPVLLMQSMQDEVVNEGSGRYLANRLKNAQVNYVELEHSEHVATMGAEKALIAETIGQFMARTIETKGDS